MLFKKKKGYEREDGHTLRVPTPKGFVTHNMSLLKIDVPQSITDLPLLVSTTGGIYERTLFEIIRTYNRWPSDNLVPPETHNDASSRRFVVKVHPKMATLWEEALKRRMHTPAYALHCASMIQVILVGGAKLTGWDDNLRRLYAADIVAVQTAPITKLSDEMNLRFNKLCSDVVKLDKKSFMRMYNMTRDCLVKLT